MISVGGVAIGVMALIVVLAVMSGFDRELKNKIVGVQPHLRIEKVDGIEDADRDLAAIRSHNIPGLVSASRFIEGQAILRSTKNATGVVVKGIESYKVGGYNIFVPTIDLFEAERIELQ